MLFGLLPLLVLAAIVVLVVKAIRSNGGSGATSPVSVRRFFQYITLYGVLIVVAIGFSGLLEQLLPETGDIVRRGSTDAARALAYVIVGVPVYLGIAAWVNRQLDDPRERSSLGFSFYLTATLFTALLVAGFAAFETLVWAFGVEDFDSASFSRLVVWGIIWLVHWFIVDRYLGEPRGEGHLLAGSAASFVALATALGFGLFTLFDSIYTDLYEVGIVGGVGDDLKQAAAGLIVAGAAWWIYWLRNTIRLERTVLWHIYTLLLGVLSGLAAAVGAGTGLLYLILVWFLGQPDFAAAARHFESTPALLATGFVGLGAFFYHRVVLSEAGVRERTEIRRVYEYTIAGLGLLALASGITVLLVALIQQLVPAADIVGGESQLNVVLGAITAIVVGGPLWLGFWRRIDRARRDEPHGELRSPVRRTYLTLLFGLGGVTALIGLVTAVFRIIEDALEGRFGSATISDVAPGIAVVVTTGVIAAYHWVVYREDRAESPAASSSPLREVILVGLAAPDASRTLAEQLDVRVRVWDRLDGQPAPLDIALLIEELANVTHERVVVFALPGGHQVVPFAERR